MGKCTFRALELIKKERGESRKRSVKIVFQLLLVGYTNA